MEITRNGVIINWRIIVAHLSNKRRIEKCQKAWQGCLSLPLVLEIKNIYLKTIKKGSGCGTSLEPNQIDYLKCSLEFLNPLPTTAWKSIANQ